MTDRSFCHQKLHRDDRSSYCHEMTDRSSRPTSDSVPTALTSCILCMACSNASSCSCSRFFMMAIFSVSLLGFLLSAEAESTVLLRVRWDMTTTLQDTQIVQDSWCDKNPHIMCGNNTVTFRGKWKIACLKIFEQFGNLWLQKTPLAWYFNSLTQMWKCSFIPY